MLFYYDSYFYLFLYVVLMLNYFILIIDIVLSGWIGEVDRDLFRNFLGDFDFFDFEDDDFEDELDEDVDLIKKKIIYFFYLNKWWLLFYKIDLNN